MSTAISTGRALNTPGPRDVRRGLAVLGLLLAFVLGVGQFLPAFAVPGHDQVAEVAFVAAFLMHATVGATIVWYRPGNAIGWLLLGMGLGVVLTGALTAYAYHGLVADPGSLPGAVWARWAQSWLFVPAFIGGLTLPLFLLPDGHLPSPRWRWVMAMELGALAAATVVVALRPGPIGDTVPVDNPVGVEGLDPLLDLVEMVALVVLGVGLVGALASLVVRWRNAGGRVRGQLAWALAASAVAAVLLAVAYLVDGLGAPAWLAAMLAVAAMAAPALGVGLAVLRSQLFDIELIVSRTLVWATISTVAVITYAAAIAVTSKWATEIGIALSILATSAVVLGLGAVRQWAEPRIRTRLFGFPDRPHELLFGLGDTLAGQVGTDPGPTVAAWVKAHLGLSYAALEAAGEPSSPHAPATAERFPLELEGTALGHLIVAGRGSAALSAAERSVVEDVARQVSLAVFTHRLAAEVQQSRAELVRAREHERLRIRRDVHDGIGPVLAAVPLQLDALCARLDAEDGDARDLARRVKDEVQSAVTDLRLLIDGLRPANLDHFGLAGAIGQRVRAVEDTGVRTRVEVDGDVDLLGPATQVVVLHIVSEALTNVVRHARASLVDVVVRLADGDVVVEVADDGDGAPDELSPGVGLASIRARADELQGAAQFRRGPLGGFQVVVVLPAETP